ncbi:hypothetical protein BB560_000710 [Smittium megazygosporum]|uniref:ubiquitinyl hydrolase 1 n=1 Tax=Smittium megazygosporum TaxID=133381 RepID=A0A2T9ZJK8_9FUNG|nr:hypothetical protein BB560_000710 [Smittium megazygosporum]
MASSEQQDAQEAFQLISTTLREEQQQVNNMLKLLSNSLVQYKIKPLKNPFTGLTASRLTCTKCKYTEAVRHFAFDNLSLSLPIQKRCTLEDALSEYISMEELYDVICRKCTLSESLKVNISKLKFWTMHHTKLSSSLKGSSQLKKYFKPDTFDFSSDTELVLGVYKRLKQIKKYVFKMEKTTSLFYNDDNSSSTSESDYYSDSEMISDRESDSRSSLSTSNGSSVDETSEEAKSNSNGSVQKGKNKDLKENVDLENDRFLTPETGTGNLPGAFLQKKPKNYSSPNILEINSNKCNIKNETSSNVSTEQNAIDQHEKSENRTLINNNNYLNAADSSSQDEKAVSSTNKSALEAEENDCVKAQELNVPKVDMDYLIQLAACKQQIKKYKSISNLILNAINTDVQSKISDEHLVKAYSPLSVKQTLIAKPPQILCLHLARSTFSSNSGYITKNNCKVEFPEYLDLEPYVTDGHLKLDPSQSLSGSGSYHHGNLGFQEKNNFEGVDNLGKNSRAANVGNTESKDKGTEAYSHLENENHNKPLLYKLQSVIVHFGSHSYGHFITYRRKPAFLLRSSSKLRIGDFLPQLEGISQGSPLSLQSSSRNLLNISSESGSPDFSPLSLPLDSKSKLLPDGDSENKTKKEIFKHGSKDRNPNSAPNSKKETSAAAIQQYLKTNNHEIRDQGTGKVHSNGIDVSHTNINEKASPNVHENLGVSTNNVDWYFASDEEVRKSTLSQALAANPYLLFYERV